ncbi:hypothetical protein I312_106402 [Cryptococcus bacillisporus CA1280]|uniref:uncharacterized protein n=1 Tax=Cryptococcus bacillisporus CA1280 TaxID=1296109 RepID=UPI0033676EEB
MPALKSPYREFGHSFVLLNSQNAIDSGAMLLQRRQEQRTDRKCSPMPEIVLSSSPKLYGAFQARPLNLSTS